MVIIIPSYNRTECLRWVLKSICRCEVSKIAESKRVVVVNNHPPSQETVDGILAEFSGNTTFAFRAHHRKETIPATDNWFSAVAEFAAEDEVVFFLGDDDLMLPWGLQDRYLGIQENQADMLLSDYADRIFFFDQARKYWMTGPPPAGQDQEKCARQWEFFPAKHPEASFISNHCYRNTANFRSGLGLAYAWCDSQSWLEKKVRTAMLLFYLPYAITLAGGRVVSLHSKCVFRGATADEAIRSPFQDGGNPDFYGLCAYDVFANLDFPPYKDRLALVGTRFKRGIIRGFLTMLFDEHIAWRTLAKTYRHSGLRFSDFIAVDVLYGVPTLAVKLLGLRGTRLKKMRKSKSLEMTERLLQ
jgi:hypothetical protein